MFFQVDTWQGPWTQATSSGSSWSGTVPTLQPGFHFLYAFADDGQDATSTQSGSPLVSNIAAYGFLVAPHTVTDATVTLVYRGQAFQRAKRRNMDRVEAARAAGRLRVSMETDVERIDPDTVTLVAGDRRGTLANDDVIICAGGVLPSAFLRQIGIDVEVRYGT